MLQQHAMVTSTHAGACVLQIAQVLILLPFRNAALGVVLRLAALAQAETRTDSVQHKERFVREFGDEDGASPQVRPQSVPLRLCVATRGSATGGAAAGCPESGCSQKATISTNGWVLAGCERRGAQAGGAPGAVRGQLRRPLPPWHQADPVRWPAILRGNSASSCDALAEADDI